MENLFPQAPSSLSVEKPGLRLVEGAGREGGGGVLIFEKPGLVSW